MSKNVSGIYKIINKLNGMYYVGSSNDINGPRGRWYEHIGGLRGNRHENKHLQRAWNKYGQDAFEFVVVKEVPVKYLLREEQYHLDLAKKDKRRTYNMNFLSTGGGGFTGHKHTEESKRRTSLALKGRPKRHRGIKRPQSSGNKNPMWKPISEEQKQTIKSLYTSLGYTKALQTARKTARKTFGIGSKVFFRLYREFKPSLQ